MAFELGQVHIGAFTTLAPESSGRKCVRISSAECSELRNDVLHQVASSSLEDCRAGDDETE